MEDKAMRVTLSTGVVLRIKPVSPFLLQTIKSAQEKAKPRVPVWHNTEDDRDEENPSDPAYLEAVRAWNSELGDKVYSALIAYGTEPETVPDAVPKAESDDWSEGLQAIEVSVPAKGRGRYIAWVKYIAAITGEDTAAINLACLRAMGLAEEDVAKAAASFRGEQGRPANIGGTGQT
jgi:hypothetical protein